MLEILADHLGGHLNKVHTDIGTLKYLQEVYSIKTMIDVGCGPGWQIREALQLGIDAYGIDGDYTIEWPDDINDRVYLFDFQDGFPDIPFEFDLAWSVEFLEHVEEKYMDNYMDLFQTCKYVVCTHATPGMPGHHHVNLQYADYWIEKFDDYGFDFEQQTTKEIRQVSTMVKPFMQTSGMFFVRK